MPSPLEAPGQTWFAQGQNCGRLVTGTWRIFAASLAMLSGFVAALLDNDDFHI